jgi:hypothetical protein
MARNNLIVNPSFKTNTTGWSATGSSTLSKDRGDGGGWNFSCKDSVV